MEQQFCQFWPEILPGHIEGTAPGADYLLLKTEDIGSEFPCEEDFWAAGAEFADSSGADIISSSLGYFNFDDPSLNYKYSDLDGNTAFVTKAADIAASKGILVVNSAGNERNKDMETYYLSLLMEIVFLQSELLTEIILFQLFLQPDLQLMEE